MGNREFGKTLLQGGPESRNTLLMGDIDQGSGDYRDLPRSSRDKPAKQVSSRAARGYIVDADKGQTRWRHVWWRF